jgi:hypothetical protein
MTVPGGVTSRGFAEPLLDLPIKTNFAGAAGLTIDLPTAAWKG